MLYLHSNGKVTAVLRIYLTSNATANVKFGGCEALEYLKTELSDGRLAQMLVNNTKTSYIGKYGRNVYVRFHSFRRRSYV